MTEYINMLRERFITNGEHKKFRKPLADKYEQAEKWRGASDTERAVMRLQYVLENETPVVFADEKIALLRTVSTLPEIWTKDEADALKEKFYIHEQGKVCNITPEYALLFCGFDKKREEINDKLKNTDDEKSVSFLHSLLRTMDIIEAFARRYRDEAERVGNKTIADLFSRIPREEPRSFHEALQFIRLIHYCLWTSFNYHNTLGRLDQYLLPYYDGDADKALELLEEFFLSCNKDSDLYTGMQQGDNGQSIVLGGLNPDGTESFNDLSELCLKACEELRLIDPKINLRVNAKTPPALYERGTHLTKLGLGFPQYANDDIIIPCLKHWGYDEHDAHNYAVAACWELIIPGYGMDIPNVNGLSFIEIIKENMAELPKCADFNGFLDKIKDGIFAHAKKLAESVKNVYMEPAPLLSLMMRDTIAKCKDISLGNKYNNYGFHGTGLSSAVDSLAAISEYVFKKKEFSAEKMCEMVERDFAGFEKEQNMLRCEAPKMGNDDDEVDALATKLLDWFADSLEGFRNDRGGIFRAGTGSAMYYIWHAKDMGATPDGRSKGEPLACNYSPSLFSRLKGPVSIIKSFTKPNLKRVANGGPLTIELDDTVFRSAESVGKVAMFVKSFIDMGGHQMQINAVNRDKMRDAKLHPANYKNLIVRVWGWSGYFVELDEEYQDHIIERMELAV